MTEVTRRSPDKIQRFAGERLASEAAMPALRVRLSTSYVLLPRNGGSNLISNSFIIRNDDRLSVTELTAVPHCANVGRAKVTDGRKFSHRARRDFTIAPQKRKRREFSTLDFLQGSLVQ